MNTEDLRAFYAVGRHGSVQAAARSLKVTQPAVSHRLAGLERELGKKLKGRAGHKLVFTADGQALFERCRAAFEILDAAEADLRGEKAVLQGAVRIASMSEWSKAFLLPKIEAFSKKNPSVEFHLQYRPQFETISALARHEVDMAFSNEPYRRPQAEMVEVGEERIVCVGRGPSRRLTWKDAAELRWIGYGAEDPVGFEFEQLAATKGVVLSRPRLQVSDVDSVLRLAAGGAGYALAPDHALRLRRLPGLAAHHLPCGPIVKKVYLFRLKTVPMGGAVAAFWNMMTQTGKRR
jgi:DNA-binding transcriptional LysR family regulator